VKHSCSENMPHR